MKDLRTVNDFNKEYLYHYWLKESEEAARPNTKARIIRSAIFYSVIVLLVVLAFFYSGNKNPSKRFGPFAYNTILTTSMQSVYPQGSLVTSWAIKPAEAVKAGLADGTDIVYTRQDGTVVCHRIVEVLDDYEDSGQRAFRTQGVDNPQPDPWITYEGNVIGRVTWHVPYVGAALLFVATNLLWIIVLLVVISVIITLLKITFAKEPRTVGGGPVTGGGGVLPPGGGGRGGPGLAGGPGGGPGPGPGFGGKSGPGPGLAGNRNSQAKTHQSAGHIDVLSVPTTERR
ncbi:MAG: signal peptidase I [Coriobacteriia bacterium]|nr:signal peptidase I [Coriobacteriia bacterium]